MNNLQDEDYRNMLAHFRVSDLKALLEAFGQNNVGRRTELRRRALELLRSKPIGLNYAAYLSKIYEIYHHMPSPQSNFSNNSSSMQTQPNQMMSMSHIQIPQQRMLQLPQYHQQPMPQARLPHLMTKMEGGIYGNPTGANTIPRNTMANNHVQFMSGRYQPVRPQFFVPTPRPPPRPIRIPSNNQYVYAMIENTCKLGLNPSTGGNNNALLPSSQILPNIRFKKLPFYDVIENIVKPTLLDNSERSNFTKGVRECIIQHTMTVDQANLIAMNRDISYGNKQYNYQYQIRICQLEYDVCEVTDYLPIGLRIQVNKDYCTLPPTISNVHTGVKSRRTGRPINIAQHLKLSPVVKNVITINWNPDGKKYAMAMYIVKELSVDTLMKILHDKNVRSSEETKNYIIKKLTNFDPDLTATSSYNFSLVCPLSKVRMKIPAKSIHCDHIQCFDAGTFILMNKENPKWMCPTCNKSCFYDDIRIENYFLEIVTNPTLQDDINEIILMSDGSWVLPEKNKDINKTIDNKVTPIDLIDLDSSGDEKFIESKAKPRLGGSECQESENLKPHLVDLTIDEDE